MSLEGLSDDEDWDATPVVVAPRPRPLSLSISMPTTAAPQGVMLRGA